MPSILEIYNNESSGDSSGNSVSSSSSVLFVQKLPRLFLICDYCFWSASAINLRRHDVVSCPMCDKVVSRIPISENESYTFSYDRSHGVEVEFTSVR